MTLGRKDHAQCLGTGMCLLSTNPSKIGARAVSQEGSRTSLNRAMCVPVRARVYPEQGHFLNLLAFSNIERWPMAHGWPRTPPRSFLLRSSPGTSLTMQPIPNLAQSKHTKPLQNGAWTRSVQ